MTPRFTLIFYIMAIWLVMAVLAQWVPDVSATVVLVVAITTHTLLVAVGMIHQKRQLKKGMLTDIPEFSSQYVPKVSLLVPCHNEANVIAHTVKNLLTLDYPHYEVLVIDDRSQDGTGDVLTALQQELELQHTQFHIHLRPAHATPGKSAVLNEAMEMVDGEILAVFDADARIDPLFLQKTVPYLADRKVGAVQARKAIANAGANILTRCQDYEYALDAHFQCGRDTVCRAVELRGNGQLTKREAVMDAGGWNEHSLTDDLDLSSKLHLKGWDIRFARKAVVREEGVVDFGSLVKQRCRWGEGSLRRYLEYGGQMLFSPEPSFRAKADMMTYFFQFLLPLWVLSDYAVVIIGFFLGILTKMHLIGSLVVMPLITLYFVVSLFVSILRFYSIGKVRALFWSMMTTVYLSCFWIPVVCYVTLKVLLKKQELNWFKPSRMGFSERSVV